MKLKEYDLFDLTMMILILTMAFAITVVGIISAVSELILKQ